ncbi:MAG: MMPL family transporter, partial [Myxococcota bacterium]|nr:MMPL family transporter [Myxococcota bacterium]
MSDARIRGLFAAAVLAMAAYCATHLELSTDVTNFMPEESHRELAVLASRLADSELTRTMVLTVGAPETQTAVAVARELAARVEDHPEVAWLRAGLDPDQLEHLYRLYFPRRHRFLSDRPEQEIPPRVTPEALRARARAAREALALPTSPLGARLLAADPLGAFEDLVARLRAHGPALATHDGHFVTADGRWAVVFLATRASAFDSAPQARLLDDLHRAFREIAARRGAAGDELVLEASGANRFAVAAERSIRRDVVVISAASFLGVGAVFLAFLRSLRFFLLAVFPPLTGMLAGATATRAVLGHLDGLTMAFGASLIGVAIDYSIHVIDHHRLEPETAPREIVRRLRPSLVLGAATTMASFAGLGLTSFPGFREIGFFAITGVAAALVVTLFVLPGFLGAPRAAGVPPLARRTARGLAAGVRALGARRRLLVLVPLAAAVAMAVFVPRLRFVDDLSRLMAMD